jgi:uncharacterized cupin superfamily protein
MEPSTLIDPASFLTADTHETVHIAWRSADGNVTAGVWECAPFKEHYDRYGVDEICTVLRGSLTITDDSGHSENFGPGDTFVMDRAFKGTWHVTETLRKFWMIHEPIA